MTPPYPSHLPRRDPQALRPFAHLDRLGIDQAHDLMPFNCFFAHLRSHHLCPACSKCGHYSLGESGHYSFALTPGLLALVLVAKYCDYLPLYRQSGIYAREGVELERSTLADWVGQCNALLRLLVAALQKHVLSGDKLHADDTPVPVLAPGEGKTKTGRLWTYVRDDRPAGQETPPAVWFAYSPNRRGEHPQAHLKPFKGVLQADAYGGFNALYADGTINL